MTKATFLSGVLRFQRHIQAVAAQNFIVASDYKYLQHYHENESGRFIKFLIYDSHRKDISSEQQYLVSLSEILGPLIRTIRLHRSLVAVRAPIGSVGASDRIIEKVQLLAFEAYHFAERLKLYGDATQACLIEVPEHDLFRREIGKTIATFKRSADDWFRYRNYVVHGPKRKSDPFAELLAWEFGALSLHNDLWLDFRNAFDECRSTWITKTKILIHSMLQATEAVESHNIRLIDMRLLSFTINLDAPVSSSFTRESHLPDKDKWDEHSTSRRKA